MNQKLIFTNLVGGAIDALVDELGAKDVFVLTDTNTSQFVMPLLVNDSAVVAKGRRITIPSGEIRILSSLPMCGSSFQCQRPHGRRCLSMSAAACLPISAALQRRPSSAA